VKIAVWHNLPSGGAKRVLHYHVAGLIRRGHQVESWCPPSAETGYLPLGELVPEHVVPLPDRPPEPSTRWEIRRRLLDGGRKRVHAMIEHSRRCADDIGRGGFDIVFANTCHEFLSPYIGRFLRSPKLLYLQEPARPLYEAMPELPWLAIPDDGRPWWNLVKWKYRAIDYLHNAANRRKALEEVTNARAFDTILANSFYSRESILRAYGLDPRVCYLGIDTHLFRPLGLARRRMIVGLAAFHRTKGVETAVEAVGCLPEPRPPLVWIANSASDVYIDEMHRLARDRGVDLQIKLLLPDDEVVRLLNEAAVMLYVSRLEPFGLAPLEANACGTPVVAVAEGGVRETIQDGVNGLVVDRDPARIAQALTRLLDHPAEAREMGQRAAAHVARQWGVEQSVDRLESELQRCAGLPRRGG
jgi:glycosyltransferase involved in cell wall biosynthesis